MTPAINYLKKQKISFNIHKYDHDPAHESFGREAAEKLGLEPKKVFKTLVARLDNNKLVTAIIPVDRMLNMKLLAKSCSAKKAEMADKSDVEKTTGYILGGVSPLGQKKKLTTVVCISAQGLETIFVSAGRRGLEIELSPSDLIRLTNAGFADISQ